MEQKRAVHPIGEAGAETPRSLSGRQVPAVPAVNGSPSSSSNLPIAAANDPLLERMSDAFFVLDGEWRFTYINAAAECALDCRREDVLGLPIWEALPALRKTALRIRLDRALHDGVAVTFNASWPPPMRQYAIRAYPDAQTGGLAVYFQEAPERVGAAPRARDERYRVLFDLVPVAAYSCDADGVIQEYNQRAVALWGRAPKRGDERERYHGTLQLYYPDGTPMPHDVSPIARVLRGETVAERDAELLAERPDGERKHVLAYPHALRNAHGEITGAINCLYDITERKRAEAARRESEERLAIELADTQRLQHISGQLMREGNLDDLSHEILAATIAIMHSEMGSLQMLYPERNELRLLAWNGFDPASAAFWEWVRVDSGSSCGVALRTRERVIVPDVERCDFMAGTDDLAFSRRSGIRAVQSTPLVSRDGHLVGMISTHWRVPHQPAERELRLLDVLARQAADLIERRHAEEAAARLAAIVASAEDAIASKTLDSIVTSWNASAERMFGYTEQEMIGQSIRRIIPADRQDEEDRILARLRAGERVEHLETVRMTKDGQPLEVLLTISPVRDSAGAIIGASNISRDITERKRIEAARHESEEKFRTLADNIPTLAWMARPDGYIFWYNQRWYDYTGAPPESRERWSWQSAHDPDILPRVLEQWRHSLATGEPFEMVLPLKGADGVFRPFLTRTVPVNGEHGQVVRWFGTATDVSELRAAEGALRAANHRMDEFLHTATHELKSPLTALQATLQLTERRVQRLLAPTAASPAESSVAPPAPRPDLQPELQAIAQLLGRTLHQIRRQTRLVNDLVDAARIQADKLDLHPVPCDLAMIVREAVAEQRAVRPGRQIQLTEGSSTEGPSTEGPSMPIAADADRIGQVITNYLTNALKYSPADRPVEITLRGEGATARVAVRDQGPGIPAEEQEHVWSRGHRVPGIEPVAEGVGLGLGLHISRTIIERHGGQVGVESAPGQGSTFWFTLPLHPAGA